MKNVKMHKWKKEEKKGMKNMTGKENEKRERERERKKGNEEEICKKKEGKKFKKIRKNKQKEK